MKVGYALGGGGGRGGFQAGALYSLHKNHIEPTVISGISVGALNGIMVATGQYQAMKDIWHSITDDQVRDEIGAFKYGLRFALYKIGIRKPKIGYWGSGPLQSLVRKHLVGQTTVCDYYAGVVYPETNEFENLHIPKGTKFTEENVDQFVEYIVASTAIPAIFEPINVNDRMAVDGGVHHQMPLTPLSDVLGEADHIIGITMKGGRYRGAKIRNDLDMVKWVIPSLLDQTAVDDFEVFELINKLVELNGGPIEWRGKPRYKYPSTIIRPLKSLSPGTRFHHAFSIPDFVHGRRLAQSITPESII